MEVIDLQCSIELKGPLSKIELFRNRYLNKYGKVKDMVLKLFSLFGSTYVHEQTSSIMNLSKNKLRPNLTDVNLSSILKIVTNELKPNIDKEVENIQSQPSH